MKWDVIIKWPKETVAKLKEVRVWGKGMGDGMLKIDGEGRELEGL